MSVVVAEGSPLAAALVNVINPKLIEVGWTTDESQESPLTEYIVLMLVNGKTQDQIAAELATDLLSLSADDPVALEFAAWLFQQVDILNAQINGVPAPQHSDSIQASIDSITESASGDVGMGDASVAGQDADMGDATNGTSSSAVPTGPKSMRNSGGNQRGRDKRLFGQMNKAMDRSGDAALHRVRTGASGVGRINAHGNRDPPKGPRNQGISNRLQSQMSASARTQQQPQMPQMPQMNNFMPGANPMMTLSPEQQMQVLQMYEQQARMFAEMLSPGQQQNLINNSFPNPGAAAFTPSFPNQNHQQTGPSLFDRIDGKTQKTNGHYAQNASQQRHGKSQYQKKGDVMQLDAPADAVAEGGGEAHKEHKEAFDVMCKFNLRCTNPDCPYAHQSPSAPPGVAVDMTDVCSFGAACKNHKCVAKHPSPAKKMTHQAEQNCKFFPNCTNPRCPFKHPDMPACRNGADCTVPNCKFWHSKVECKFNPCMNPACPYKHIEGQKRGKFEDKVWTADGKAKEHVSERRFINDQDEELIIPGSNENSESVGLTQIITEAPVDEVS